MTDFTKDLVGGEIAAPSGRIGNPIPPGFILVPGNIDIVEQIALRWNGPATKQVKPPVDLVQAFADCFNASSVEILEFASRYGVLGMTNEARFSREPNFISGIEPFAEWRSLGSQVRSILRAAAMMNELRAVGPENIVGEPAPRCQFHGHPMLATKNALEIRYLCPVPECSETRHFETFGPISEWAEFELRTLHEGTSPDNSGYFWRGKPFPSGPKAKSAIVRECLDWALYDWLYRFPSTIALEREHEQLELRLDHRYGLLSVIALQLMQAVARRAIYFCSECKQPFVRFGGSRLERKPKANMDRFCDRETCGRRAAVRRASERMRAKKTEALRLAETGLSATEIAMRVKSPIITVRRWTKQKRG